MVKKILVGLGVVVGLVAVMSYMIYKPSSEPVEGSVTFMYYYSDVIGTHVGTSTVGVSFGLTGTQSATSSYVSKIGGNISIANYTIRIVSSSAPANIRVQLWGSNDDWCGTATTSSATEPETTDINWFNAGRHLEGVSLTNDLGGVVLPWTAPTSTDGDEILLTNLNYECLKLDISGSSTAVYAGLRTK